MSFTSNNGIFIKYRKPFFKNGVNYLNDNKINFFVKVDEIYNHCTFTLAFEERYSKETLEYYINPGETLFDINYDEIDKVLELYERYRRKKVMILSPYKDQVKILKNKLKDN